MDRDNYIYWPVGLVGFELTYEERNSGFFHVPPSALHPWRQLVRLRIGLRIHHQVLTKGRSGHLVDKTSFESY